MNYVTVEECDRYVQTHFTSTDENFENWANLIEEDKQVLLNKAHGIIESLPITGRKTSVAQPNAFPRYPAKEIPDNVKAAECELAVALSDAATNESLKDYQRMVDYGIQSYHIGNFGETLLSYSKQSVAIQYGMVSDTAKRLLKPWLSGGFRIG